MKRRFLLTPAMLRYVKDFQIDIFLDIESFSDKPVSLKLIAIYLHLDDLLFS